MENCFCDLNSAKSISMKMNLFVIIVVLLFAISCTTNNAMYNKYSFSENYKDTLNKIAQNCDENTFFIKKSDCKTVRIPCSGLLLKDYCSIYNLSIEEGVENVNSYNALFGIIICSNDYQFFLYFDEEDYVQNFYLLENNIDFKSLQNNKIIRTEIFTISNNNRKLFNKETDTLFIK